jgi:Fic family protein
VLTIREHIEDLIFKLSKSLSNYIYNISSQEGNNMTLPDIETLVQGYSVGGYTLKEEQEVINLLTAYKYTINLVRSGEFTLSKKLLLKIHSMTGYGITKAWGEFRSEPVAIGGTIDYRCPDHERLEQRFKEGFKSRLERYSGKELAIELFLWLCYSQFFIDCNKRTARIFINGYLINEGLGIFDIPIKKVREYNRLMCRYYDTLEKDKVKRFLLGCIE